MFVDEFALAKLDSKAKLRELRDRLLDRRRWPEYFRWNYSYCNQCAMELGKDLWTEKFPSEFNFWNNRLLDLAKSFNISIKNAEMIFIHAYRGKDCGAWDTTPEMVAEEINKVL